MACVQKVSGCTIPDDVCVTDVVTFSGCELRINDISIAVANLGSNLLSLILVLDTNSSSIVSYEWTMYDSNPTVNNINIFSLLGTGTTNDTLHVSMIHPFTSSLKQSTTNVKCKVTDNTGCTSTKTCALVVTYNEGILSFEVAIDCTTTFNAPIPEFIFTDIQDTQFTIAASEDLRSYCCDVILNHNPTTTELYHGYGVFTSLSPFNISSGLLANTDYTLTVSLHKPNGTRNDISHNFTTLP